MRVILVSILLSWATPGSPGAQPGSLPIQRIVLYKHGVGYFERAGTVEDRQTIALRFRQEQMSDVLKSLTVLDRGGGRIRAIAYDSQKPAEQLLREFAFDLRTGDVRRALLEQLRGAEIEGELAGRGRIEGAIVGLETYLEPESDRTVERVSVSVLTSDGEIVTADLDDLVAFRFTDPLLRGEIGRYLRILRSAQHRGEKTVDLVCDGSGTRQVFAAYAIEQPVWKATYRLVLGGDGDPPYLQGWAVVDNPSTEDWEDVELSLVAGMPVSFRMDLYTPRFRQRPWLMVEEDASVSFAGLEGLGNVEEKAKSPDRALAADKLRARFAGRVALDRREEAESEDDDFGRAWSLAEEIQSQQAESVSREVGDLLVYEIDHPVTIPRQRSALLRIVAGAVEGERVALFNEAARSRNPMSAVRFVNTTGVTLEGGAVTVLEGDTYAGESLIDGVKEGETRYVPYAVELGIKATTEYGSRTDRIHRIEVAHGVMRSFFREVATRTYAFDNRNDDARTVVVEHPRRDGFEVRSPEATEEELDRYRFRIEVPARSRRELAVVEEAVRESAYQISNIDADAILRLQEGGVLTDELLEFLKEVVRDKAAIAGLEHRLRAIDAELQQVASDQERVRKNLSALRGSAEEKDLRAEYVRQLKDDETRVRELKKTREGVERDLGTLRKALEQKLLGAVFTVEKR